MRFRKFRPLLAADPGVVHFQAPCKKRPPSCAAEFLLAHGAAIEHPDDQPWTTPRFWARHLEEPAMMQALADERYHVLRIAFVEILFERPSHERDRSAHVAAGSDEDEVLCWWRGEGERP